MTELTNEQIDASLEAAKAFVESMPVEADARLQAAMGAVIAAAGSAGKAAIAFARAGTFMSGGLVLVTVTFGTGETAHRECFGPSGAVVLHDPPDGPAH